MLLEGNKAHRLTYPFRKENFMSLKKISSYYDKDLKEWLEQFEPFDITNAADEIIGLYIGSAEGMSEVKKKAGDAVKEN